jgi:hypothetical protein
MAINNIDNIINTDLSNIDQRVSILNLYYKKWLDEEDEEIDTYNNYNKTISPIIILCMFKKYLNNNSYNLLFSKNLLIYFNEYIDKKARKFYLETKYKKKWLNNYINKKEPTNPYDLELNPINPLKYYINYIDYKERKKYFFTLDDFKKIICSSLENCCSYDLIPDPIPIRNPYTNKNFTVAELDNINKKLYDMPPIWYMFLDSKFNISILKKKYQYHLIPLCIPSYVDQLNDGDIIEYIVYICEDYNVNYCEQCLLRDHIDISTQKIKNIVIESIKCRTFNKIMSRECIDQIKYTYALLYCCHSQSSDTDEDVMIDILEEKEEKYALELDFTKPLFCTGYKNKDDRKKYFRRRREKEIKIRFKNRISL